MVPTIRNRKSGAKTNSLRADMSQTPTEQTPLNTSPAQQIFVSKEIRVCIAPQSLPSTLPIAKMVIVKAAGRAQVTKWK